MFSRDVTSAILLFQNKGKSAMLVYQTDALEIELCFYPNIVFSFSKPIWPLVTWVKTRYYGSRPELANAKFNYHDDTMLPHLTGCLAIHSSPPCYLLPHEPSEIQFSFITLLIFVRILTMGLALVVVPFLPASNVFFTVGFVVAERVLYLSSIGSCLITVLGFTLLSKIRAGKKVGYMYICHNVVYSSAVLFMITSSLSAMG